MQKRFLNLIFVFTAITATTSAVKAQEEFQAQFDYPIFRTVTLPNFPDMEVPIYKGPGSSGPAVLMVHGNSSSARAFTFQYASSLAKNYRTFLIDLPGFGRASKVDPSLPLPRTEIGVPIGFPQYQLGLIEAIAMAANHPDVQAQVVVGWSLGGDLSILAYGAGYLPQVRGLFIFGSAPVGANSPTRVNPFLAPSVPNVPGLQLLPSFGFAFRFDSNSPMGFDLNARFTDPVPSYAPKKIKKSPNVGDAYVRSFFSEPLRSSKFIPSFFVEDAFDRSDWRARASIGAAAMGFVPPGPVPVPDQLQVLANMTIPIAIAVGSQEALVNPRYLNSLKNAGAIPTLWKGRIQTVGGAGHAIQFERPVQFHMLLSDFVNSVK